MTLLLLRFSGCSAEDDVVELEKSSLTCAVEEEEEFLLRSASIAEDDEACWPGKVMDD